ncbi:MAG: hypothetical protein M3401_13405 [Actinomycetota bacterium]|nr:hypothetical protein [Actinomycetota bacterium]
MTRKAEFNAEEWSTLVSAPLLCAMLVVAADKGGSVRESVAATRSYAAARERHDGEFMSALLATPPASGGARKPRSREELQAEAFAALREAIDILDRVGTEDEVIEYKRFIFSLAQDIARAHKEGGFLGIGGTEISEREQAALDEIAAIFDET